MSQTAVLPSPESSAPRYPSNPLWGALFEFAQDSLHTLTRISALGEVVRFRAGAVTGVLITGPRELEQVLLTNARNYGKRTRSYDVLRLALGEGLVTSDGEFWKKQRRTIQPGFHKQRIESFVSKMVACSEELAAQWRTRPGYFDVHRDLTRLTLRVVSQCLWSRDVNDESDEVGDAITHGLKFLEKRSSGPALPIWVPTPAHLHFKRTQRTLKQTVAEIVRSRQHAPRNGDLLDMLLEAQDPETGTGMDERQIHDEVMTLFIAGHETTSAALSWTLYLLSLHPKTERAVQEELREVLGGRPPTVADLPRLNLLGRVISESMRLYPPVWAVDRAPLAEDTLGGERVTPRDVVVLCQWLTHRLPSLWPNPERFDPDRFLPQNEESRPRCAYFPFLTGGRKCIGDVFALTELKVVLSVLLQRFSFQLSPGRAVIPEPVVTLRPKGGLWMKPVEPRWN